MGFQNSENIFDLRVTPKVKSQESNPKNFEVEYLENGTIDRKVSIEVR